MGARNYGEYCGLAHALELVGERWGLLVIRELLSGPKRFTDLARGLHRIPSNVLSARLKELESFGVVERRILPRPSGGVAYALTEYGRELDAVLVLLAGWGAKSLGEPREGDVMNANAVLLGMRANFRPQVAGDLQATYEIRFGDDVVHARIAGGELEVATGPAGDPDLTIEADPSMRAVLAGGQSDTIGLIGDRALFDRFVEIFRIEPIPDVPPAI